MSRLTERIVHAIGSGFLGALIGVLLGTPRAGFLLGFLVGLVSRPTGLTRTLTRLGTLGGAILVGLFFLPLIGLIGLSLLPVLLLVGLGVLSYSLLGGPGGIDSAPLDDKPREAVVGLLAAVVQKSPGGRRIQFELVRRFLRRLGPSSDPQSLWNRFLQYREESIDVEELTGTVRVGTRPAERRYLMQVLVSLALVPDRVPPELRELLKTVADSFGIPPAEVERLLRRGKSGGDRGGFGGPTGGGRRRRSERGSSRSTRSMDLREAYRILGVDPSVSQEDVKKAYQKKVKQHHPDRHRNDENGQYEEAEEKMARVNQAYQRIKETWS